MSKKKKKSVGRPKGSKNKKSVGRPKGAKNKKSVGRPKGAKNKRPVGRPKGKKKEITNAGFGITSYNRVRKLLWSNFKEDFESYRLFVSNVKDKNGVPIKGTSIVSRVYNECKGVACLDRDILLIYEQLVNIDDIAPEFDVELTEFEDNYYWQLLSDPSLWILPTNIWVTCSQCLVSPDFFLGVLGNDTILDKNGEPISLRKFDADKGDTLIYGKKQRFKPFVDFLNRLVQEELDNVDEYGARFRFVGQIDKNGERLPLAKRNEQLKRWEIEIEIVDVDGERTNFGFEPTIPDDDYTPVDIPYVPLATDVDDVDDDVDNIAQPLDEIDKQLNRLLKKKADIREDIRLWKDIDDKDEMKKSIAELKKIQAEINKIN